MIRVKICGITNLDDANVAVDAGADLLGFIFYPKSPRYVEPERARAIVTALRADAHAPKFVGVFVNESLKSVKAAIDLAQLDLVQLHGSEPASMVLELSPRAYKSLRPRDADEARTAVAEYRGAIKGTVPAFIVDAYDAKRFGGTGTRADWEIAASIAREFPVLLAGGLTAENVADAMATVQPWGVDVSSGVERAPGLKDHVKVREFIRAVKQSTKDEGRRTDESASVTGLPSSARGVG
jgi:phosphoribosylanthranilate isomerase